MFAKVMEKANYDYTGLRKPIEDRMRNPFFSSFMLSWLVINWKAIYTLLTYSKVCIHGYAISSVVDAAASFLNPNTCFTFPILSALFFTLVYPWFENNIVDINSKLKAEQTQIKYKNLGKFNVPGKWLQESLENNQKILQSVKDIEVVNSGFKIEIEGKDEEISSLKKENDDLNMQLIKVSEKSNELSKLNDGISKWLKNKAWKMVLGDPSDSYKTALIKADSDSRIISIEGKPLFDILFIKYEDKKLIIFVRELFEPNEVYYNLVRTNDDELNKMKPDMLRYGTFQIESIEDDIMKGFYYILALHSQERTPYVTARFYLEDSHSYRNIYLPNTQ